MIVINIIRNYKNETKYIKITNKLVCIVGDIADIVEDLSNLSDIDSIVLTDESGSPIELPGVEEDDEKAAIAAFVGSGVSHIADTLDLDEFHSMTMTHDSGIFMVYPIGTLYLGVVLSENKKVFKIESKINQILNGH